MICTKEKKIFDKYTLTNWFTIVCFSIFKRRRTLERKIELVYYCTFTRYMKYSLIYVRLYWNYHQLIFFYLPHIIVNTILSFIHGKFDYLLPYSCLFLNIFLDRVEPNLPEATKWEKTN